MQAQTQTTSATPGAQSPIDIVQSFFHALEANDLDRAFAYFADDIVYQNVPFPADRGKAQVLRTFKLLQRVVTSFKVRIKNIAVRDGVVLTERTDILSGPLVYLDLWVCGTFEVRDGKITLWRDYFDLAETSAKLVVGPLRKLLGLTR
jgi:limonene-1,2-epoxide hydrolase